MKEHLDRLEGKVVQLVTLCDSLRADNLRLQAQVGTLETEKADLAARMTEARTRLEGMMERLPAE